MAALCVAVGAADARVAAQTQPDAAVAQEQARALGQCMVDSTTGYDRIAVARWMLGAMASAPQMKGLVTVDAAQKIEADKRMAAIFTRLMTVDCATQARPLFKAKNREGFEAAGGALGKIAVQELLANAETAKALAAYTAYLNESDFAKVVK